MTPPKESTSMRQLTENEEKKQSAERPSTAVNEII